MGVGSKDSVPAGFPKKDSGLAPEGLSILAGTGAGHRPLWRPTMALKIKIPGEPVGHPGASFPVPTRLASGKCGSICEGRGRPRMISTAFDPAFLSTRKGVARRPDFCCGMSAHKERNPTQKSYRLRGHFLLSSATKGSKNAAGSFAPGLPENVPIFSS